jgi:tRNA modification GTPase
VHADEERVARREAAIVTHVPGTTRDILEISLDIGGLPVVVADTAGLRETADEVEQIGIERARKAWVPSAPSHLILDKMLIITRHSCCACPCLCACVRAMFVCGCSHRVQAADASLLVLACPDAVSFVTPSGPRLDVPAELAPLVTQNTFILLNKTDLLPTSAPVPPTTALTKALQQPQHTWAVSLASHAGTSDFLAGLAKALQDRCGSFPDARLTGFART